MRKLSCITDRIRSVTSIAKTWKIKARKPEDDKLEIAAVDL